MLQFLDYFLTVFHSAFVLFILTGWATKATRKAHWVALALTAGAWIILGAWYGWGYCPLTDWQWNIKRQLGEQHLPYSFIKYMIDKVTNWNTDSKLIDIVTTAGLIISLLLAIFTTLRQRKRKDSIKSK